MLSITELSIQGIESHEDKLYTIIRANAGYRDAQKRFLNHLETLKPDVTLMSEVEDSATTMESVAKDVAFDEGFKLGVRLVIDAMSNGMK